MKQSHEQEKEHEHEQDPCSSFEEASTISNLSSSSTTTSTCSSSSSFDTTDDASSANSSRSSLPHVSPTHQKRAFKVLSWEIRLIYISCKSHKHRRYS
ncbi:hypothetical protein M8C21_017047 [Ambrosia artemisiifolia]|uniref:Uncharacterized protein n=1 Tax=Ambrosia artemisiifolia TaxID=4212 RepID=A0AAD5C3B8_AMBAR|nr:hypothetical protein M8C21_017047 [Ambrosia artemisiifolia]